MLRCPSHCESSIGSLACQGSNLSQCFTFAGRPEQIELNESEYLFQMCINIRKCIVIYVTEHTVFDPVQEVGSNKAQHVVKV